jgi:DNA-binding XRE family transcriptional regulator
MWSGGVIMDKKDRLKYFRKDILNMTQDEFSKRINISQPNLGNIETGKVGMTGRVINDICRTFDLNPDWLITGTDPMYVENTKNKSEIQEIVKVYTELSDRNKGYLKGYIHRLFEEQNSAN